MLKLSFVFLLKEHKGQFYQLFSVEIHYPTISRYVDVFLVSKDIAEKMV